MKNKTTEFEFLVKLLDDYAETKDELFLRNLLRDSMEVSLNELAPLIVSILPQDFHMHNAIEFGKDISYMMHIPELDKFLDKDHIKALNAYLNHKFRVRFLNELFTRCCILRLKKDR